MMSDAPELSRLDLDFEQWDRIGPLRFDMTGDDAFQALDAGGFDPGWNSNSSWLDSISRDSISRKTEKLLRQLEEPRSTRIEADGLQVVLGSSDLIVEVSVDGLSFGEQIDGSRLTRSVILGGLDLLRMSAAVVLDGLKSQGFRTRRKKHDWFRSDRIIDVVHLARASASGSVAGCRLRRTSATIQRDYPLA